MSSCCLMSRLTMLDTVVTTPVWNSWASYVINGHVVVVVVLFGIFVLWVY